MTASLPRYDTQDASVSSPLLNPTLTNVTAAQPAAYLPRSHDDGLNNVLVPR